MTVKNTPKRVRGLAASLERDGCTCHLDIHKDTNEDWPAWMKRQLIEADIVLCLVTETYKRRFDNRELPDMGLGVGWEAGLIRCLLYAEKLHNNRIFPVFFDPADRRHIPLELQGYDHFPLDGPDGYEFLLRKILNRPLHKRSKSGSAPDLPTHTTAPLFPRPGGDEYGVEADAPLAKILDHDQLATIHNLLDDDDRPIALAEACSEDWPSYLADHVHLNPWPNGDDNPPEAITLRLKRFDKQALWEALIKTLPGALKVPDEAARQAVVRGWINGADLRVFYLHLAPTLQRHHA